MIFRETHGRDDLGRVTETRAQVQGEAEQVRSFTCALSGRLEAVGVDGAPACAFGLDARGNLTTVTRPSGATTMTVGSSSIGNASSGDGGPVLARPSMRPARVHDHDGPAAFGDPRASSAEPKTPAAAGRTTSCRMVDMTAPASSRIAVQFEVEASAQPWFLEEEDVPEIPTHDLAILLLIDILRVWIRHTGRNAFAARNLGCRWDPADARRGMDPDIALLEPAPADPEEMSTLRCYAPGEPTPRLVIEVVSATTAKKDYEDAHLRAAKIGAEELWVFDPKRVGPSSSGGPYRLQVWRRAAGELTTMRRVHAGEGPAFSPLANGWLVVTDGGHRLRLADDEAGARLWPTPMELEQSARLEAEAARGEAEAARRRAEEAEAELARLRALLEEG